MGARRAERISGCRTGLGFAEGLKTRLDVAAAIGRQSGGVDPRDFVDQIFGPAVSAETRQAVLRAESRPQAIAIALMAPEFQRR